MKLKRNVAKKVYEAQIDAMYANKELMKINKK